MASTLIATKSQRQLVDEAMDAYVDWREECIALSDAYGRWTAARPAEAALAFRGYVAALDREERASEVYAGVIGRVGALVATDDEPAAAAVAAWAGQR